MNSIPYSYSYESSYNSSYYFNGTVGDPVDEHSAFEIWLHLVILTTLFIIGIPANAVVIIVLLFSRTKGFSVTSMYIINMAVVDLVLLCAQAPMKLKEIAISQTSHDHDLIWEPSTWGCRIMVGIVYINMTVSIFTLMALSFSRYCAVMHPVGARADMSKGRTLLVLLCIWAVCLLYCVYPICHVIVHPDIKMCVEGWGTPLKRFIFSGSLTLFFYLSPLFIICVCYASMAKVLWNAGMDISRNRSGAARRKSRRKIARMVLILVVCFALCWLPYHTRVLLEMAGAISDTSFHFHFAFLSRAFAYLNSCLNPLLYSFLGENFRSQMRDVFFCVDRMSFMKTPNTGITDLHEMEGSRRGGNTSAETQTTYESHAKVITSKAL